ncbi:uncharacterized protein [Rutidosis leptorrhynchoides]|uniref:uncharacterized protein n=1 Tax=Rutidosis leptorrhynchoides TaxID=125765 RepID=UPI003A9A3AD9
MIKHASSFDQVSSIIDVRAKYNDSWGWRYLLSLRDKIKPHIHYNSGVNNEDCVWITNEGKKVNYSTQQVWLDLRSNKSKVNWHHVVWFKLFDPKSAFILWLAILNRLNTQDRLEKWMTNQSFVCALCEKTKDSVNHLFFLCEYSIKIWRNLKANLVFQGLPNCLNEIVSRLAQYPYTNKIWNIINRLVLAACVYWIWKERNCRIFKKKKRSEDELCKEIVNFIRLKLLTFKVKQSNAVIKVAKIWRLRWANMKFYMD